MRCQAAIGISLLKYSPAIFELIELLGDQEVNKIAAKALRTINDPRGIAAIEEYKKKVNRCNQPLLEEENTESIEANADKEFSSMPIAWMSKNEKDKKKEEIWIQYRNSKDPSEKAGLLSVLGRLGDHRIFNELGRNDYEILRSIFNSLQFFHAPEAVNALVAAFKQFPAAKEDYSSRKFYFTDPALASSLLPLIDSNDETIYSLAEESLIHMGEPHALGKLQDKLLYSAMHARSPRNQYELKRTLKRVISKPIKKFIDDLKSTNPAKRFLACAMLEDDREIDAITPLMQNAFDPHPQVSEKAIDVLWTWKGHRDWITQQPFSDSGITLSFNAGEHEFYSKFDETLDQWRKSAEFERLLDAQATDFTDSIKRLKLLALFADERIVTLGHSLLKQFTSDRDKIFLVLQILGKAENASLNQQLIKWLGKKINSLTDENSEYFWILLELIKNTEDKDAVPLLIQLLKNLNSAELQNEKLASTKQIIMEKSLSVLLELGDRRVLSFVSDIYAHSEEQNHQLARQILLKIDYAATKSRLIKEIKEDDYMLFSDLAEAAIREKDRELAMYLVNKKASTHLILQMADLLPDEYLNRPATIEMIGKDIDSFFYVRDSNASVDHVFSRLNRECRWHLCEKAINANTSESMPTWLRNELFHGGHPGAVDLIVKALGDPELKTERKLFLIEVAIETCSDEVIATLSKLFSGSSARLSESAAKALAKIGNETAIQALLSALISDRLFAREYAMDALLSLGKETIDIATLAGSQKNDVLKQWREISQSRQATADLKFDQPSISAPTAISDQLASLVIVVENGIEKLELDPKTKQYIPKNNRDAAGLRYLAIGNNQIFTANFNRVFALDKNLNAKAECVVPDIAAIAPAGSILFAAAGGHMLTFNEGLTLISKTGLEIPGDEGEWKNAHDIIIKGRSAYLIDDVSYPYYVVQIDINHPAQPKIQSKQKIDDINQHLSMQFISGKEGTWNVVQDQFHEGGKFQNLLQFSLSDGQLIRRLEREMESPGQEDPEILAVTSNVPGWAVASYGEHLALVRVEKPADFANPAPALYLGIDTDNRNKEMTDWFGNITANICQLGELLYITANRQLWVVRAGESPQIILHQTLDKPIIKLAVMPE